MRSVLPKRSVLLCVFSWQKDSNAKDIHKEVFPVYGGKGLSRKAGYNWVVKYFHGHSKVADDETEVRTTFRRLLCRGFRHTGRAMGQVYQCWWRICREINVSSRFECHIFYVLFSFVTYLLTLPHVLQPFPLV
jgi:hypothetical protein